jgi:Nucleotide modification associated domain 2
MARIYFYKLTADAGVAPCVKRGLLSLAICKPIVRSTANGGDLIFGFAANSLHRDNPLIYAARVTRKLCNGEYYKDSRYASRRDCIYRFQSDHFVRRKHPLHDKLHDGPNDLVHDLGNHPEYRRANVLLSTDFRYFGKAGSDKYKSKFPAVRKAVESLGQGHRVQLDTAVRDELLAMKDWVWRNNRSKVSGPPTSAPSRRTCHRARYWAVV